jgi:hypothetical protein
MEIVIVGHPYSELSIHESVTKTKLIGLYQIGESNFRNYKPDNDISKGVDRFIHVSFYKVKDNSWYITYSFILLNVIPAGSRQNDRFLAVSVAVNKQMFTDLCQVFHLIDDVLINCATENRLINRLSNGDLQWRTDYSRDISTVIDEIKGKLSILTLQDIPESNSSPFSSTPQLVVNLSLTESRLINIELRRFQDCYYKKQGFILGNNSMLGINEYRLIDDILTPPNYFPSTASSQSIQIFLNTLLKEQREIKDHVKQNNIMLEGLVPDTISVISDFYIKFQNKCDENNSKIINLFDLLKEVKNSISNFYIKIDEIMNRNGSSNHKAIEKKKQWCFNVKIIIAIAIVIVIVISKFYSDIQSPKTLPPLHSQPVNNIANNQTGQGKEDSVDTNPSALNNSQSSTQQNTDEFLTVKVPTSDGSGMSTIDNIIKAYCNTDSIEKYVLAKKIIEAENNAHIVKMQSKFENSNPLDMTLPNQNSISLPRAHCSISPLPITSSNSSYIVLHGENIEGIRKKICNSIALNVFKDNILKNNKNLNDRSNNNKGKSINALLQKDEVLKIPKICSSQQQ